MIRRTLTLMTAIAMSACGGGGGGSAPAEPQNRAPVANAGADAAIDIAPGPYPLSAASSTDPDGDALSYSWDVIAEPAGSMVSLTDAATVAPSFESMVPGDYEFRVTVRDPAGLSSSDSVLITLVNEAPVIAVTFNTNPVIGEDIAFDTAGTTDSNGHAFSFTWELVELPAASGMPTTYTGPSPVMQFDEPGNYRLEVRVTDGYDESVETWDTVDVTAFRTTRLANYFTDAGFDANQQRIVTVLSDQLFIVSPDGTETPVQLPTNATAVSVSPDGRTAAVAHDGWVSHVDLDAASVIDTIGVAANLGDIVLDGQGYAYGFPETGQWVRVLITDLAAGTSVDSTGNLTRHRTKARLHPSGTKIYAADNGVSPSDVERYSVGGGAGNLDYDSPYHGDFPFCGDLWFDVAGDTMLSACRVVVRTTDDRNTDMTYVGQLGSEFTRIRHAAASNFDNAWYVIDGTPITGSTALRTYDLSSQAPRETLNLPYLDDTQTKRWIGRYVFPSGDSKTVYVLAVDDDASFLRYALLERVNPVIGNLNYAPEAVTPRYLTQRVSDSIAIDGSASNDPEGQPLTYQWTLVSEPAGSSIAPSLDQPVLAFSPSVPGVYAFELVVNDGERSSAVSHSTVNVFDTGADLVHRLQGSVDDAEYSRSLNALVYLSSVDGNLHILDLADFSSRVVTMGQPAFRVGVAPDGLFAAVSHKGTVSLVDLTQGVVTDTQSYPADWGDIVLDHNYRAHLVPIRDQHSDFVSIDFTTNQSDLSGGPYAGTQVRMHPVNNWVYGADRGLSPSDFEKWDVSTFPGSYLGDSPYHGDYAISGNLWISEDGDRILVAGGNTFRSSSDPLLDMTYSGAIADAIRPDWADHSTERNEWVVVNSDSTGVPPLTEVLVYYEDMFFNHLRYTTTAPIPTPAGDVPSTPRMAFFSDDGTAVIALIEASGITDGFAVQLTSPE